jgi:hypothetical protein
MLNTAMDVSAGTGLDLGSATKILSQAYVGNYKGLQQLNLGLTKAELSSKSYLEIEKLIATQYAGQSKNAAESYQGGLERLKIAAEQASEEIGQSLVSALSISSGGMDKLIDKVDGTSNSISGLITNIAVLSKDLGDLFAGLPGAGVLDNIKGAIKNRLGALSIGRARDLVDKIKGRQGGFPQGVPQDIKNMQANTEKAKMDKLALQRQKELIALQKKAQLAEKNKIALNKAAAVFDSTRISIAAALKATYDKETRLRLEALMAIEDEDGATALARIAELAAFQKSAELDKLKGLKTISSATLEAINTQLLTELAAINSSKMAEEDKEIARNVAFGKYNAAIIAAGELADKASYSERAQIQLTEIARLASLSKTENAMATAAVLREQAELSMIDRVAKAQAVADAARMKALQDYAAALGKVGTGTPGTGGGGGGGGSGGGPGSFQPATIADVKTKEAADAVAYFAESVTDVFQTVEDSGLFNALVNTFAGGSINSFNAGSLKGTEGSISNFTSQGAFDRDIKVELTVNTAIGDPEAIARVVADVLNQSTYRGTATNRDTGIYTQ